MRHDIINTLTIIVVIIIKSYDTIHDTIINSIIYIYAITVI